MSGARSSSTSSGSMRSRKNGRRRRAEGRRARVDFRPSCLVPQRFVRPLLISLLLASSLVARPSSVAAQRPDSASFYRALALETAGKYKEAVPLFRAALRSSAVTSALLGLERVYAELGWA